MNNVLKLLDELEAKWLGAYPTTVFLPVPPERQAKDAVAADLLRLYIPRIFGNIREEMQELISEQEQGIRRLREAVKAAVINRPHPENPLCGSSLADELLDKLDAGLAALDGIAALAKEEDKV